MRERHPFLDERGAGEPGIEFVIAREPVDGAAGAAKTFAAARAADDLMASVFDGAHDRGMLGHNMAFAHDVHVDHVRLNALALAFLFARFGVRLHVHSLCLPR